MLCGRIASGVTAFSSWHAITHHQLVVLSVTAPCIADLETALSSEAKEQLYGCIVTLALTLQHWKRRTACATLHCLHRQLTWER